MISVIVCSVNPVLFDNLAKNIAETIGCNYEIVKIDNSGNPYGLAEAYNKGAEKSIYPYFCFVHEDVKFVSRDWGGLLIGCFGREKGLGAIGVAGSKYKSLSPSGWPVAEQDLDCYHFIQFYRQHHKNIPQINNPHPDRSLVEVKVIDGVFIFTTRDIWDANRFDHRTFNGFHGYDLDFSLQVGLNHKIMVSYEILLEHLSEGATGKEWLKYMILLSEKWKRHLPQGALADPRKKRLEWLQKRDFFLKMLICKYTLKEALNVFFDFGYFKYFSLAGNFHFAQEIVNSFWRKARKIRRT